MSIQVKGAALKSRQEFVEREYGHGSWEKILDQLSEADSNELRAGIIASRWYPFDLSDRLDKAIVATLGKGSRQVFEAIGARSARTNLTGSPKGFLSPGDPQRLLTLTDKIYGFYYDIGRGTYQAAGPNSGAITTFDAETFSETDCLTLIGWYREALTMCGAKKVRMVEVSYRARGVPHCRYEIVWD